MKNSSDLIAELEAGGLIDELAQAVEFDGRAVVAEIGAGALDADGGLGPALTQCAPGRPRLGRALAEASLARLFPGSSRKSLLALAAGLLQIHDFWVESHAAAQDADDLGETGFSAYWHGIAHRREPDAGNAAYWFRRVGRHAIHPALARAAEAILSEPGEHRLASRVVGPSGWNPRAMIDLCGSVRVGSPDEALARRFQRAEMQILLEATVGALAPPPG